MEQLVTELHNNLTGYIKSQMDKRINCEKIKPLYTVIYMHIYFFFFPLEGYLETANSDSLWEEGVGEKLPS